MDRHARYNSSHKGRARQQRREALAARRAYRAAWMRGHRRTTASKPDMDDATVNHDARKTVNHDTDRRVVYDDSPATQEPDYDGGPPHDR